MPRVITNSVSLSRAREATLGVLPIAPLWFQLEPNNPSKFGETIDKKTRSPISKSRARRKGAVTDKDSGVEFECDTTLYHMRLIAEEFCFAQAQGGPIFSPTDVDADTYTIPAASATAAGRMKYGASAAKTLLFGRGFRNPENNGLLVLGAAVAPGATSITVTGVTAETLSADQFAEIAVAGVRGAVGDLTIDTDGNLLSTVLDFTTLGLIKGQRIHLGGVDALHQFASDDNFGLVRVVGIAAHKLTLDKRPSGELTDTAAATAIDIMFGAFVRNVAVDHADYVEWSTQFEIANPNLMEDGDTGYEYALGNWPNQWTIALPMSDKSTMTLTYVGTSTTVPDVSRATGSANAKQSAESEAFGTASDIARLTLEDVDELGLTTDFKTMTVTLKNNTQPEKVLAHLGPKYLNAGNLEVDVDSTMLFSSADVIAAIKANETVGLDFALVNDDGGAVFDLPTGTLGDGGREFPANQSVTIKTPFAAHQEPTLDFTIGISFFPVLP